MIKGDLHRFGKQVSLSHNGQVILKPRPTLIEHLLLDNRSPINDLRNDLGLYSNTYIRPIDDWNGECENLTPYLLSDDEIKKDLDFFVATAGKLIATATVLGLNDLHFENVLFIKKEGQLAIAPVDLEIIYYKFITSAECCLYPSIKASDDLCGFKRLIPFLTENFISLMIDHTIETWTPATMASSRIAEQLGNVPVRMIYRKSQLYANYLSTKNLELFKTEPIDLTAEELFQLNQGDIPYFFSRYSEPQKILYFDSLDTEAEAQEIISHPTTNRHLTGQLSGEDQKLFYTSIAHLIVNLIKTKKINFQKMQGSHFTAEMHDKQLIISVKDQILKVLI